MLVSGPLRFVENAPAIACGRSRAVAQRFGPAPIRAGRRHTRLNPGEREWRDERVNRCEDCACEPPVAFAPACGSARGLFVDLMTDAQSCDGVLGGGTPISPSSGVSNQSPVPSRG